MSEVQINVTIRRNNDLTFSAAVVCRGEGRPWHFERHGLPTGEAAWTFVNEYAKDWFDTQPMPISSRR